MAALVALGVLGAAGPASADASPSLSGEELLAGDNAPGTGTFAMTSRDCDRAGQSSCSFQVTGGKALGNYPGTLDEAVTVTMGP